MTAASAGQTLSLPALTAMVIGSTIGAGILSLSLPQTFGGATGRSRH